MLIMLRLNDFVTCRKDTRVGWSISLEHCRKMKFRTYLHLTPISKIFMYIWSSVVYI